MASRPDAPLPIGVHRIRDGQILPASQTHDQFHRPYPRHRGSLTLQDIARRVDNMQPVLQGIVERFVERAKHRFDTSTGPHGARWKPNSAARLDMLAAHLGKSFRRKDGGLNRKGAERIAGKKPLIGESGYLRRQIVELATRHRVTVKASPVYAAIHQFGGEAGRGKKVNIPARPFLPVRQDGTLYPAEQAEILREVSEYLVHGLWSGSRCFHPPRRLVSGYFPTRN